SRTAIAAVTTKPTDAAAQTPRPKRYHAIASMTAMTERAPTHSQGVTSATGRLLASPPPRPHWTIRYDAAAPTRTPPVIPLLSTPRPRPLHRPSGSVTGGRRWRRRTRTS